MTTRQPRPQGLGNEVDYTITDRNQLIQVGFLDSPSHGSKQINRRTSHTSTGRFVVQILKVAFLKAFSPLIKDLTVLSYHNSFGGLQLRIKHLLH